MEEFEQKIGKHIAGVAVKALHSFVPKLEPQDITFKLFSGVIELRNVYVPESTLDVLADMLPYRVNSLYIGRIHLRLPLFNLLESPIEVIIEDLHCLLYAQDFADHRSKAKPKSFTPTLQVVGAALSDVEATAEPSSSAHTNTSLTSTLMRIISAIVDNIRIRVSGVKVEVRDTITNPRHPIRAQLALDRISLAKCDIDGSELMNENDVSYRPTLASNLKINALFVALSSYDTTLFNDDSDDERHVMMKKMIAPAHHDVILSHEHEACILINLCLGTMSDRVESGFEMETKSWINAEIGLNTLKASICDEQMSIVWDTLQRLSWWMRCAELEWLRPTGRVQDCPGAWWRFARSCLREELNTRLGMMGRTTWSCVLLAAVRRRRYQRLYRRYLRGSLHVDEAIELQKLDMHLTADCAKRYRAPIERKYGKKTILQRFTSLWQSKKKAKQNSVLPANDNVIEDTTDNVSRVDSPLSPVDSDFSRSHFDNDLTISPRSTNSFATPNDLIDTSSNVTMSLRCCNLEACLTNRDQTTPLLDIGISPVVICYGMSLLGTEMNATIVIGSVNSSNKLADSLRIECPASSKMLEAEWSMRYDEDCTRMHVSATMSETTLHVPGPFVSRLPMWLFPTSFYPAPPIEFMLLPWDLFASEIAAIQADLTQRSVLVPFRTSLDARIARFSLSANAGGNDYGSIVFEIDQLIARGDVADSHNVNCLQFSEFKPEHHVLPASGMGVCDVYDVFISDFGLYYKLPGDNTQRFDVLNVRIPNNDMTLSRASMSRDAWSLSTHAFHATAIVAMITLKENNVPPLLADAMLRPIVLCISDSLYHIVMDVLMSFLPSEEQSETTLCETQKNDVDFNKDSPNTVIDTQSNMNDNNVWKHSSEQNDNTTRPNLVQLGTARAAPVQEESGSRLIVRIISVEIVLVDRLIDEMQDVLRIRVQDFKMRTSIKADMSSKSAVRVRVEAWYLNHLIRLWEPLIELWSLSLLHRMDAAGSQDIVSKGDSKPFNITISSALLENLIHACQSFGFLPSPKPGRSFSSRNAILNESGLDFMFNVANDNKPSTLVASGTSASIRLPKHLRAGVSPKLSILWQDGRKLVDIVLREGCVVSDELVMAQVQLLNGVTVVNVHSRVCLCNATLQQLDVVIQDAKHREHVHSFIVPEHGRIYAPILTAAKGELMVRLHAQNVKFSEPIPIAAGDTSERNDMDIDLIAIRDTNNQLSINTNQQDSVATKGVRPIRQHGSIFLANSHCRHDLRVRIQTTIEKQLTILTVHPSIVLENMLYTGIDFIICNEDASVKYLNGYLECGQKVECFISESTLYVTFTLCDEVSTEPISLIAKKAGNAFKRNKPEIISLPLIDAKQETSAPGGFLEIERLMDTVTGTSINTLYAPFWFVNHATVPVYYREMDDIEHQRNQIPTYPNLSAQGIPLLMVGRKDTTVAGCLSLHDSQWSNIITLSTLEAGVSVNIGQQVVSNLPTSDDQSIISEHIGEQSLRVKIERATGRFRRTKVLSLIPQLVIVNTLDVDVFMRQNDIEHMQRVAANSRCLNFIWPDASQPRILRLSFEQNGLTWSGLVSMSSLGEQPLLVPSEDGRNTFVSVVVKQYFNIVYGVIKRSDDRYPPVRILNRTRWLMDISQSNTSKWCFVPPFSCKDMCWIEPLRRHSLDLRIEGQDTKAFAVDKIISTVEKWKTDKRQFYIETKIDGPTKSLIISDTKNTSKSNGGDDDDDDDDDEDDDESEANCDLIDKVKSQLSLIEGAVRFAEKRFTRDIDKLEQQKARPSQFFVSLVEAWNLEAADSNGTSDAFVEFIAGNEKQKSVTRNKELNPHFNADFALPIRDGTSSVLVIVYDEDMMRSECLGGFELNLSSFADEKMHTIWSPLFKVKKNTVNVQKKRQGRVHLVVQWVRSDEVMSCRLEHKYTQYTQRLHTASQSLLAEQKRLQTKKFNEGSTIATHALDTTIASMTSLANNHRARKPIDFTELKRQQKQRIVKGKFRLNIVAGKNVLSVDGGKSSDSYAVVQYGNTKLQTKVKTKTLNPEWNESFEIEYVHVPAERGLPIRIALFDRDNMSSDDFIGETTIFAGDFIDLPVKQCVKDWYTLQSLNPRADDLYNRELGDAAITRGDIMVGFEWLIIDIEHYTFNVNLSVRLPSVGISVVDSEQHRELLYLSLSDTLLDYQLRNDWRDFSLFFSLSELQIDNPDVNSGSSDPTRMVVLDSVRQAEDFPQPFIQLSVVSKFKSDAFDYFSYASLLVQRLKLSVNTRWISNVLWFVSNLVNLISQGYTEPRPAPLPVLEVAVFGEESGRKAFFDELNLSPISIIVSLQSGVDTAQQRHTDFDWILELISSISLQNAPIRLNALVMVNTISTYDDLANVIAMHYIKSGVSQIGPILGSSAALGDPVKLVSSVSSGVKDFFYEPAQGLVLGPAEFGRGMAKGTMSLVTGAMTGVLDSASKITGHLGKGFAALSMDEEYAADMKRAQNQVDSGAGGGQNLQSGVKGIWSGISGIALEPIKGAKNDGVKGFIKGFGRGIPGAFAKSISGSLQIASAATGTIRQVAASFDADNTKVSMLARFPRAFYGAEYIIKPYEASEAKASLLLVVVDNGTYREDVFQAQLDLVEGKTLVLSNDNIVACQIQAKAALTHKLKVKQLWSIPCEDLAIFDLDHETQVITVRRTAQSKGNNVDVSQLPTSSVSSFMRAVKSICDADDDESQMLDSKKDNDISEKDWKIASTKNNELQCAENEIARLQTELDAADSSGCMAEVEVVSCKNLDLPTHFGKTSCFVRVWIEHDADNTQNNNKSNKAKVAVSRASVALKQKAKSALSDDIEDNEVIIVESNCVEGTIHPVWNFTCALKLRSADRSSLCLKVVNKAKLGDKDVGSHRLPLSQLDLDKTYQKEVILMRKDKARGSVSLNFKLVNEARKRTLSRLTSARLHHEATLQSSGLAVAAAPTDDLPYSPELDNTNIDNEFSMNNENSELQCSSDEESYAEHGVQVNAWEREDSLIEGSQSMGNPRSVIADIVRKTGGAIDIEVTQGAKFIKAQTDSKKAPPLYVGIALENQTFKSVQMKSWMPQWRMRFSLKLPSHRSEKLKIRVRRKHFLGSKSVGKTEVDLIDLVKKSSTSSGEWVKLFGKNNKTKATCEVNIRTRVNSEVLDLISRDVF